MWQTYNKLKSKGKNLTEITWSLPRDCLPSRSEVRDKWSYTSGEQLYNLLRVKSSLLLIKDPAIKTWEATDGNPLLHLCRITGWHIFEFIHELYSLMVLLNYALQIIIIISTTSQLSRRSTSSWRILAPYPTFSINKERKRKITFNYVCSLMA